MAAWLSLALPAIQAANVVAFAADAEAPARSAELNAAVGKIVEAAGGADKLLTLFSMKESLVLNPDGVKKGSERFSVLEPPRYWWLNKADRGAEPAKFLVWAWTLGALTEPKSKLTALPEIADGEATLFGIEVGETITPAMKIYFDKRDNRIARIDWRGSIHRFSEWKEAEGLKYPARTIGSYTNGKAWYQTDISEVTRLKELPEGLKRAE